MTDSGAVSPSTHRFDFAVTFAGEDRALVSRVVQGLKDRGVSDVFYDEDFKAETWGANLVEFFERVYAQQARYAVMFVSRAYVEKHWTRLERRAAQERALTQASAYILPIRLDDTDVPGLPSTTGYLDARVEGVSGLVDLLIQKLGTSGPNETPATYDGDVPESPEAFSALLSIRPPGWEYLYFAGLLQDGIKQAEPKYRDFQLEYSDARTVRLTKADSYDFIQARLGGMSQTGGTFERLLSEEAQSAAFGAPGEPGDPERIQHLSARLISLYEWFLNAAEELRGTQYHNEDFRDAALILARVAASPIDATRSAVAELCESLHDLPARLNAGETVRMTLNIIWDLPDGAFDGFTEAIRKAMEEDR